MVAIGVGTNPEHVHRLGDPRRGQHRVHPDLAAQGDHGGLGDVVEPVEEEDDTVLARGQADQLVGAVGAGDRGPSALQRGRADGDRHPGQGEPLGVEGDAADGAGLTPLRQGFAGGREGEGRAERGERHRPAGAVRGREGSSSNVVALCVPIHLVLLVTSMLVLDSAGAKSAPTWFAPSAPGRIMEKDQTELVRSGAGVCAVARRGLRAGLPRKRTWAKTHEPRATGGRKAGRRFMRLRWRSAAQAAPLWPRRRTVSASAGRLPYIVLTGWLREARP